MNLAVALVLATAALQDKGPSWRSFQDQAPPELEVPKDDWLNAEEPPTLEKLKGRVVLIDVIGSVF